jgi:pyruvate,orthophosphate dikinase
LREIIAAEKQIILTEQSAIPEDPYEQLRVAIAAVFNSWMGRRAIDYRRVNRIPDSLGTAVNVQGNGLRQHGRRQRNRGSVHT